VTKKPNIKAIERLAKASELIDLRLVEAQCRQNTKEGPLPTHNSQQVHIATLLGKEGSIGEGHFRVIATFILTASYEESSPDPAIFIMAKFQLTFTLSKHSLAKPETLGPFGEGTGLFIVWPYWREHVNSAMARMGLPSFLVPLLRQNVLAPIEVSETAEK
jgi:hypothetical protein